MKQNYFYHKTIVFYLSNGNIIAVPNIITVPTVRQMTKKEVEELIRNSYKNNKNIVFHRIADNHKRSRRAF